MRTSYFRNQEKGAHDYDDGLRKTTEVCTRLTLTPLCNDMDWANHLEPGGWHLHYSTSLAGAVDDAFGSWLLGLIEATSAIGSLVGLLLIGQATRLQRRGLLSYLALSVSCLGILLFGLPFPRAAAPFIAPLAGLLVGFGLAFFNTIFFTVLQETVPREKLGRVISLDTLGSFAMIPIGEFLGGIMTDRLGPATVFIVFGIINLVNVLIPLLVRDVRELK